MNVYPFKAIFLSHMFPNQCKPFFAPFVAERARAISHLLSVDIVAPCSYVPFLKNDMPPYRELFDGLNVTHPRYLGVPTFLGSYRWLSYLLMCHYYWRGRPPKCNIVHIEWIYPDAYAFLHYIKRFNIKSIGVVHGNEAIGYFEKIKYRRYYVKALQMLDRIISVSSDLKQKMVAEYGIEDRKITVIPNGVQLSKFPVIKKDEARRILGLPINEPIGVCVARLSPEKNLDVLIEAISLLGNDAPLMCIIGDGPLQNTIISLSKQYQVKDKFKLIGPVPHNEIYTWLNSADFFCLPSQREGCPVVVHEALACGVPVAATAVGAIPDLINCEDYGLLCPPSNAKLLSTLISKILIRSWDRKKIAAYGRRFTWELVAQQTVQVYKEVLG